MEEEKELNPIGCARLVKQAIYYALVYRAPTSANGLHEAEKMRRLAKSELLGHFCTVFQIDESHMIRALTEKARWFETDEHKKVVFFTTRHKKRRGYGMAELLKQNKYEKEIPNEEAEGK
jgi:hypothetical protein